MQSNNHGPILVDGECYPSVSKILASDPKKKSFYKSRGLKKRTRSPGSSETVEAGRIRGRSLHECFSDYITTGEADVPPLYYEHWAQLHELISSFDITDLQWAERPLAPEHSKFQQGDTAVIYSKKSKYLGKPDLIASLGGVPCIWEIKTSNDLYSKNYDYTKFISYSSFLPYCHAALQVGAYRKAWAECTGQQIDTGIIINVTKNDSQLFIVERPELLSRQKSFTKLAKDYHAKAS